jgi:hypothetical protein
MTGKHDKVAKSAAAASPLTPTTTAGVAASLLKPANAATTPLAFPNQQSGPAKPDGFA